MSDIPARLRRRVIRRAKARCEYCGLAQVGQEATFHIDHIVPRDAGGPSTFGNLALACVSCSLRKGARRSAADPETGRIAPLYHPRRQAWEEHFRWESVRLAGRTPTGQATIALLRLNRPRLLEIRKVEKSFDRHPQQ